MSVPDGWFFDPDYCGQPTWWHDDCPTPTELPDGAQIGGIAFEERIGGHLVGVVCSDCDASISVRKRPAASHGSPASDESTAADEAAEEES